MIGLFRELLAPSLDMQVCTLPLPTYTLWINSSTDLILFAGHERDGAGGPPGTLVLAVATTPIPCKSGIIEGQKSIQFTVINVRKPGWMFAPWHKPAKNSKAVKDENTKPLFETGEWEKNDVTMERVIKVCLACRFFSVGSSSHLFCCPFLVARV